MPLTRVAYAVASTSETELTDGDELCDLQERGRRHEEENDGEKKETSGEKHPVRYIRVTKFSNLPTPGETQLTESEHATFRARLHTEPILFPILRSIIRSIPRK